MRYLKGNKAYFLLWFVLTASLLLTGSLMTYFSLTKLNNPINISDDLESVDMVSTTANSTSNVLIIFSDGLRYDKLMEANTTNIDNLMDNGVTFTNYRACLPSYSHPNYVAIATGATANITGASSNIYNELVTLPTLYGLAQDNNYSTGIVSGSPSWTDLLGNTFDNQKFVEDVHYVPDSNDKVRDAALAYIPGNFSNVQFIGFDDTDTNGHLYGAASDEYLTDIEELDVYVGEIIDMYDSLGVLNETTIVFMSDHGMHDVGGHGGESEQETHATLVLSGKGIVNNLTVSRRISTNSLTPTLLSLLGIPLGPQMNGEVVLEALDIADDIKAAYAIQSAEIMYNQYTSSLSKITILTKKQRANYVNQQAVFLDLQNTSKTSFNDTDFANATLVGLQSRIFIQEQLSGLLTEFTQNVQYLRIGAMIGGLLLILIPASIWRIRKSNRKEEYQILSNQLFIPQIIGVAAFLLIHYAFTRYRYSSIQVESITGLLFPNIYTIVVGSIAAIFLPWFFVFLFQRKKNPQYKRFKDWRIEFLRASAGSLFMLTVVGLVNACVYIYLYGLWPNWQIPATGHFYMYMLTGLITASLAIFGIIIVKILWLYERKKAKSIVL